MAQLSQTERGFDTVMAQLRQRTSEVEGQAINQLFWNQRDVWSGRRDSNSRPPAPKAGALPGCATPRLYCFSCILIQADLKLPRRSKCSTGRQLFRLAQPKFWLSSAVSPPALPANIVNPSKLQGVIGRLAPRREGKLAKFTQLFRSDRSSNSARILCSHSPKSTVQNRRSRGSGCAALCI